MNNLNQPQTKPPPVSKLDFFDFFEFNSKMKNILETDEDELDRYINSKKIMDIFTKPMN